MTLIWLPLTILSYLMQAVNGAVDRIIVHKQVTRPIVVSFWVAVFSIFTLALPLIGILPLPFAETFAFHAPTLPILLLVTVAGVMTQLGLFFTYAALEDGEATRVLSVIGALTPIVALITSFLLLDERITGLQFVAFILLVVGAIVLTIKHSPKRQVHLSSKWLIFTVGASVLLAVQSVFAKIVFDNYHFISAFSLMSLGALFYAVFLVLLVPTVKKAVWGGQGSGSSTQQGRSQVALIIGNSALGGVAVIILNYALSLGSPSFINALRGVQYAGVFIIALFLAKHHSVLLDEQLTKSAIVLKIAGIILIVNGVLLLAL